MKRRDFLAAVGLSILALAGCHPHHHRRRNDEYEYDRDTRRRSHEDRGRHNGRYR